jgi:hypothetical protein
MFQVIATMEEWMDNTTSIMRDKLLQRVNEAERAGSVPCVRDEVTGAKYRVLVDDNGVLSLDEFPNPWDFFVACTCGVRLLQCLRFRPFLDVRQLDADRI